MAVVVVCDSCEKAIKSEVSNRGVAIQRQYCSECVKLVDEMLEKIDKLHTTAAAKWKKDLARVHKQYKGKGSLPDVSDN